LDEEKAIVLEIEQILQVNSSFWDIYHNFERSFAKSLIVESVNFEHDLLLFDKIVDLESSKVIAIKMDYYSLNLLYD
jgi:hypothetical protein